MSLFLHQTPITCGMMLARLAFMTRAYKARVGPLDTISMIPMRSFSMRGSRGGLPADRFPSRHPSIHPAHLRPFVQNFRSEIFDPGFPICWKNGICRFWILPAWRWRSTLPREARPGKVRLPTAATRA